LWGPNKDDAGAIRGQLKAGYYANSFSEAARLCVKGAQPAPVELTAPLGCHQAEQDNLNGSLPDGGATSMEGGSDDLSIEQSSTVNSPAAQA
jgi:hypothetical protein